VFGRRDVIFMNKEDLARRGLSDGDRIDVTSAVRGNELEQAVRGC